MKPCTDACRGEQHDLSGEVGSGFGRMTGSAERHDTARVLNAYSRPRGTHTLGAEFRTKEAK